LGVKQYRASHLLRPVIEMSDAPERRLDATDDDRHIFESLARALRVHDDGPIRPLATLASRRVRIITANPPIPGVAIDHRIHVSGGDAEEKIRSPERLERLRAMPVRLRDDSDAKTLRLEHPTDNGHAEARVIHVGIAGDDDDVAAIPAERFHLGT